jgi:hypothetical protein
VTNESHCACDNRVRLPPPDKAVFQFQDQAIMNSLKARLVVALSGYIA